MAFKQLILLSTIVLYFKSTSSVGRTKVWTMHDEKFLNFGKDEPDCINQTFIYQRQAGVYFNIPEEINTLILPSTGSIVFPRNHQIRFIPQVKKCHSDSYDTQYFKLQLNHPKSWFDPANWQVKDQQQNKATPHIDRIPCECDTVEFPSNQSLWIDLDFVPELTVKQVTLNGKTDNFNSFLETSLGQSMFMFDGNFKEGLCDGPKSCGCHELTKFSEYFSLVCLNANVCVQPNCVNPIQPIGHCCPICGAMIQFTVNQTYCLADLQSLNQALDTTITFLNSGKYATKIDGYIGMVRGEHDEDIDFQIVAVEKEEYNELSVEFIKTMVTKKAVALDHQSSLRVSYSGRPYSPNNSTSMWFIFFGSLILVTTMFGITFAYYTDDSKLRKYNPFKRFPLFERPFVFARFDNNRDGDTDSIAVGVEFEQNPNRSASTTIYETIASAFDNPMFKSRNKEKKIETIGPNVLNEFVRDEEQDGESVTSVKLVEVELDSNEEA